MMTNVRYVFKTYPVLKGMISYGVIWPVGSLVQQTLSGNRWETYDWMKCLRFGLYGGLFVAPTLYTWVRLSTRMWPKMTLSNGITKVSSIIQFPKFTIILQKFLNSFHRPSLNN